jgi:hypothetical protein
MILRMPIARRDDTCARCRRFCHEPIDNQHDVATAGDLQCAAGAKIALNVHDDQRIVAMKPPGQVPCPPVPQPPLITGERVKGKTLH